MKFNKKYRFLLLAIPFFIIALLLLLDGFSICTVLLLKLAQPVL